MPLLDASSMGFILILVFIFCCIIQLWLLRSRIYLLLASRFFNKIKFTSQIYGDTSLQSLAQSFLHSLELHLLDNLFASPTKSATDSRSIFCAASAEADDIHPMTTFSANTTTQLIPATSTTLNMAAPNSCYLQMPRHLSCTEEEKQDWSMATNMLPENILVEILARLPVKTLLRFRSVSKSWREMLKEPFFITKHLLTQVALNNGNSVLTMAYITGQGRESKFALLTKAEQEIKSTFFDFPFFLDSPSSFDMKLKGHYGEYQVVGPCNGLVLVSNWDDDRLFICNPATREYKALPPASVSRSWLDKWCRCYCILGFGIDPITKDYKVVRTWTYRVNGETISINKSEVFCLKGGCESWRIIDDVPPVTLDGTVIGGAYYNGKYYWYIETPMEYTCRIVWFDMGAEVFGSVEYPDSLYPNYAGVSRLTTFMLKGELCLAMIRLAKKIEEDLNMYEIWILKEDGFSWTNYATVGPFPIYEYPLGFIGKNEELFVFNSNEDLAVFNSNDDGYTLPSCVYNINTHAKKKIMLGLLFQIELPLAIYNETLVSVI